MQISSKNGIEPRTLNQTVPTIWQIRRSSSGGSEMIEKAIVKF
jgi:hypothetical protein